MGSSDRDPFLKPIADYYGDKIRNHGPVARGVDWKSEESQELRFEQLCKLLPTTGPFSLLDYGCGYGAVLQYLQSRLPGSRVDYTGFDISEEMLEAGRALKIDPAARWVSELSQTQSFEYLVASGIFNVRLEKSDQDWEQYILGTLEKFHALSTQGFAFNALSSYSDPEFRKDYLFYADPKKFFDVCKTKYSKKVALLHDYPLYEFTIIVRK